MEKLVVVIMGQDCEKFISMCLESAKDADAIVYCDGGSTWETLSIFDEFKNVDFRGGKDIDKCMLIENKYDQKDLNMNGKQRNFYLDYVKKNYPGWWCLAIDADEVVDDISKVKEFINSIKPPAEDIVFSPKMRHLIGNLGYEDATVQIHFVPHRLFKINDDLHYPECEHPVLRGGKDERYAQTQAFTIWHMSHISEAFSVKKKFDNHMKKSKIHSPEFLKVWYRQHLFGQYPVKPINLAELPSPILNNFGIDKDELYFINRRQMEVKHYQDAIDWKEFFKCEDAILFGCGFGQRVKILNQLGVNAVGVELSKYAVDNTIDAQFVYHGNVLVHREPPSDLVVAYDLLEHLKYAVLDVAIDNLIQHSKKNILVSVPFKGTPHCDNDPTHIIKEDKDWWIKKFTDKGLKLIKTPDHFLFKEQILIFEK